MHRANRGLAGTHRISAANYRNGTSSTAQAVVALASERVGRLINPILRKTLAIDV
jgi:hypothetical protein